MEFMTRKPLSALILLLTLGPPIHWTYPARVAAQAPPGAKQGGQSPEELTRRTSVIKPRADENKWQQIPWITDVSAGLRQSRAEQRPVLLWTIMGEPLDEC